MAPVPQVAAQQPVGAVVTSGSDALGHAGSGSAAVQVPHSGPAMSCPAVELADQVYGGNRQGKKGKNRKSAGQQSTAAVQQQLGKEQPILKTIGEGPAVGDRPPSSAGRGLEGVEGCKLDSGSGDGHGVAPTSVQIGSVVQGLAAVATDSISRSWADECDACVGDNRPIERTASTATASKTKLKGKAPISSK